MANNGTEGPFESPPDEGAAGEEAAVAFEAPATDEELAITGVPTALLEAKRAVEARLQESVRAAGRGAVAAEDVAGVANLQGVALGLAEPDPIGRLPSRAEPGAPVLTVYVAEPQSEPSLRELLTLDEDIAVNLRVTGVIQAFAHTWRLRPAPPGASIGHQAVTAGTFGCLATGRRRMLVLSNNHVLANSNNGMAGDPVLQPGDYDGGSLPADQLGSLERFVQIRFDGQPNAVDAATAWVEPSSAHGRPIYWDRDAQIWRYLQLGTMPVEPTIDLSVGKSGRTSQLTKGRVTGVGATIRVRFGRDGVAVFGGQFAVRGDNRDFGEPGDSGSCIWTWNSPHNPVGLLFAGGGGETFANRMTQVVAALDVRIVG